MVQNGLKRFKMVKGLKLYKTTLKDLNCCNQIKINKVLKCFEAA